MDHIFIAGIGAFLLVALVEAALGMRWSRLYFYIGIPIFRYVVAAANAPPESSADIEAALPASGFVPLRVRKLDVGVFACRESGWGGLDKLSYTPVMRFRLEYNDDGSLAVVGLATWSVIVFVLLWFAFLSYAADVFFFLLFGGFLIGLLTWIYRTQAKRLKELAHAAARVGG